MQKLLHRSSAILLSPTITPTITTTNTYINTLKSFVSLQKIHRFAYSSDHSNNNNNSHNPDGGVDGLGEDGEKSQQQMPGFLSKLQRQHEHIDPKIFQNPLFILPIKTPLFPHNSLVTRINPLLQAALQENSIEYVGAFVLRDDDPRKVQWLLTHKNHPLQHQMAQPQIVLRGQAQPAFQQHSSTGGKNQQKKSQQQQQQQQQQQFKFKQFINEADFKKQLEQLEENNYQNIIYDDSLLSGGSNSVNSSSSNRQQDSLGDQKHQQSQQNSSSSYLHSRGIPGVTDLDAIYKMGTLCKIRYQTINDQGQDLTFAILRGLQKIQIISESKQYFEIVLPASSSASASTTTNTTAQNQQKQASPGSAQKNSSNNNSKANSSFSSLSQNNNEDDYSSSSQNITLDGKTNINNNSKSTKNQNFFESSSFSSTSEEKSSGSVVQGSSPLSEKAKSSQRMHFFVRCQPLRDSQQEKLMIDNQYKLKLSELLGLYAKLRMKVPINVPELQFNPADPRTIDILSGFLCLTSFFQRSELMKLFETVMLQQRLKVCLDLFRRYEEALSAQWDKLERQNTLPVDVHTSQKQMENIYNFLKQQFTSPGAQQLTEKLRRTLKGRTLPPQVRQMVEDELNGLAELSEQHPDFNVKRSFLELVSALPFGIQTQDNFDLDNARKVLDQDHFGIDEVKQRILEFIAVAKLKGKVQGKTLLLVGPPGVGKSSIAVSIAKCLGRKFARISLGGEYDVAVIKGHRKTYMGSYPGKIVQALKVAGAENPVILLDEIDKTARSYRGNIQDALLEVLDPVQNSKFVDNYIEIPIDLSKVLFVCSANLLETIHPALLDRTEVIELSGYTTEEKEQIFSKHLLPKIMKQSGLSNQTNIAVSFSTHCVEKLIKDYAREAGVRSLERLLKRICEKVALKIITKNIAKDSQYVIDPSQLKQLVGLPIYAQKRMYDGVPPPGIIVGLAYNGFGGSIIYIETNKYNFQTAERGQTQQKQQQQQPQQQQQQKQEQEQITVIREIPSPLLQQKQPQQSKRTIRRVGVLKLTGQVGEVMQESIQIAYTYAKYVCFNFFDNSFLEENDVHIHFPSGASKKDGPSAGISITTSLISLALNRQTEKEVAMTGEISLTGKVLKIGGVKEKILAAKREGIMCLIFPMANKLDVELLKDYIKKDLEIHFAENYFDVIKVVFKSMVNDNKKINA